LGIIILDCPDITVCERVVISGKTGSSLKNR